MSRASLHALAGGALRRAVVRAGPGSGLQRTQAGLLYADDFEDLSGWTAGTGWTHRDEQTFVSFGRFPRPFFNGAVGSYDRDGVREGQVYVEDGVWWLLYDGGDHSTGWREFLASSEDRGLTWTKHGQVMGLDNGEGGSWAAVATGWLEKRGVTYYLHRVTCTITFGGSLPGLPFGGYRWDTWSASDLLGAWTWVANVPVPVGVDWAASEWLPCSVVKDGSTYYAFGQGGAGTTYTAGYATGPSPTGPWTMEPTAQFSNVWFGESRYPENVKVFYHPGLGRWVALGNVIAPTKDFTDRNFIGIGDDVGDWSAAQREYNQTIFPIDSAARVVGVQTHLTGPDGEFLYDEATGNVPVVYDGSATSFDTGLALGRTIHASELELSPGAAQYDSDAAVLGVLSRPLAHDDIDVEFAVKFHSNLSGSSIQLWFRCNEAMTDGYRLVVRNLGTLLLQKVVGGSVSTVYSNPGGAPYLAEGPMMVHRIRLKVAGNAFNFWQDGQQHNVPTTDSSHASGTHVALAGFSAHAEVRKLSIRTGVTNLVINGLPSSADVVLRSRGGLPVDQATAVAGVATFTDLIHGPYGSVDIDGTRYAVEDGIWPGDVLSV